MVSVVAKLAKRSVRREEAKKLPVGANSTSRSNASEKKGKACATIHSQVIRT
jgi:hypothetical protein